VGFLMVVLARQQLFTENTITAVLPIATRPTWVNLGRLGRLWGVVLAANLAGTLFAALFCCLTPVLPPEIRGGMLAIAQEGVGGGALHVFFHGISAGFLIATLVWLLPSAQGAEFWVITLMTWLIAVGGFAHIVAGSFEAFMLLVSGRVAAVPLLTEFALPALAGNIVGGTALFTLIAYAQVAQEVPK
jgi:formate/nitrite transporter FocA (FNT family)